MYKYVHTYTYTHIHTYIHVSVHQYAHISTNVASAHLVAFCAIPQSSNSLLKVGRRGAYFDLDSVRKYNE